jgi:4-hydroxybenzoate polyprenyltransferase
MMSLTKPTAQSPFVVRFVAYLNERFPAWLVAGQIPLFLVAFLAGRLLVGRPAAVTSAAYIGFVAFVAYTFAARALDDHKDYDHDTRHYPERVLQRGQITLMHLKIAGALCFALSMVGSLVIDWGVGWVTFWWVISVATNGVFQVSMIRNPTMKAWLEERRVIFALAHLPFWGVGGVWIAQMGAGDKTLPWSAGWLVALWIVGPLLLEFARKSRAPEDERSTVVDYTKPRTSWAHSLGLQGAVAALVILAVLTALLGAALLRAVGSGTPTAYWALAGSAALVLIPVTVRFAMGPSRKRAKEVAELSASSMIVGQIVLVVVMLFRG